MYVYIVYTQCVLRHLYSCGEWDFYGCSISTHFVNSAFFGLPIIRTYTVYRTICTFVRSFIRLNTRMYVRLKRSFVCSLTCSML